MYNKQKTSIAFKKAKSHLEKILQMIDQDTYCIDIMQQNLAVIGLLKSAHQQLMEGHLNSCFKHAMEKGDEQTKQKMVTEMLTVTKLFNR